MSPIRISRIPTNSRVREVKLGPLTTAMGLTQRKRCGWRQHYARIWRITTRLLTASRETRR